MKNILALFLFVTIQYSVAQNIEMKNSDDQQLYLVTRVDKKPEFPGGISKFDEYVRDNFKKSDREIKGMIFTSFVVEKDGSLSDIKIIRDLGPDTNKEALRILQNSPKWIPGEIGGKIVRVVNLSAMKLE